VRQHVPHKRTFLYLEQLILRAGADAQCINIKDNHEGLDFFFANRAHGLKLIDFLQVRAFLFFMRTVVNWGLQGAVVAAGSNMSWQALFKV
jgi:NMD protein affecting ribosome stability and mRNA decay